MQRGYFALLYKIDLRWTITSPQRVARHSASPPHPSVLRKRPRFWKFYRRRHHACGELGVKHISLFGSTARGTQRPESDIDLLFDLDEQRKIDLFDYAGIVAEIQKLVPQQVDVALRNKLKSHVAPEALRDEIRVF